MIDVMPEQLVGLDEVVRQRRRPNARAGVAAWVEDYNRDRRHSALGMRSPLDYECALREQPPEAA